MKLPAPGLRVRVLVEGPVGCGKSVFAKDICDFFDDRFRDIRVDTVEINNTGTAVPTITRQRSDPTCLDSLMEVRINQ